MTDGRLAGPVQGEGLTSMAQEFGVVDELPWVSVLTLATQLYVFTKTHRTV